MRLLSPRTRQWVLAGILPAPPVPWNGHSIWADDGGANDSWWSMVGLFTGPTEQPPRIRGDDHAWLTVDAVLYVCPWRHKTELWWPRDCGDQHDHEFGADNLEWAWYYQHPAPDRSWPFQDWFVVEAVE